MMLAEYLHLLCSLPAIAVATHVKVKMIAMRCIIVRAENGSKTLAGALVDRGQKLSFPAVAIPVAGQGNSPAICKNETGDINGIGVRMLRQAAGSRNIATTVTAHRFNPCQLAAEILARRAFDRKFCPGRKFAGQLAFDGPKVGDICADIQQFNAVDLTASALKIAIWERRKADIRLAELAETLPGRR